MLEITYAFIGYIFGCVSLLIALWVWLVVDEMKFNGRRWIELNKDLLERVQNLEKQSGVRSPFRK